ncbi:MAG TPA: hypothetical protein VK654_01065 [Nitrospirota bacterium]|nr:hypothetical protein [Nitrospirota bacterium]
MNRIENKKTIADSAKLFEQEVLELDSDVPRDELCDMVDDYLYYQADDVSRAEAKKVVDATCRAGET